VGVARQVGEHRLRSGERGLGIDDPALLANRRQVTEERAPFGEMRQVAEEGELAGMMERDKPGQEQPPEQRAQERRPRRYPALAPRFDAAAGTIMWTCG
jgi:hypothetical protein